MPASIQELRPDMVEKAAAFAKSCGCKLAPGRVVGALSLAVRDGDDYLAVLLCVESHSRHRLELGHGPAGIDPQVQRLLIDKALMKLHGAGVGTCDLSTNGGPSDPAFWGAVSWIGQTLGDAA